VKEAHLVVANNFLPLSITKATKLEIDRTLNVFPLTTILEMITIIKQVILMVKGSNNPKNIFNMKNDHKISGIIIMVSNNTARL